MIRITKKDLLWSYGSQIFQMASGVFLLPIILRKLPSEELAIWYIFLSITALVNLLDLGLQPTIMRNVSYLFSGAKILLAEGTSLEKNDGQVDYGLVKNLINTIKKLYLKIGILVTFLLVVFGSSYIYSIVKLLPNKENIMIAWVMYIISASFNFYFYYYTPLLLGRGQITESNKTIVFSKLLGMLLSIIGLLLGYGLLAVAMSNLLSSFLNRILSHNFFYDNELKEELKNTKINKSINMNKVLRKNSIKLGVVSIGAFCITKANTLIASKYLNLSVVASYGLTLQIIGLLVSISSVHFRTMIPKFNMLRVSKNTEKLKKEFSIAMIISYTIYTLGSITILLLGNYILLFLKSNTLLLPKEILIIILVMLFLEMNHSNFATLITTKNEVPFVAPAIISGFFIIVFSLISITYFELGLIGIILSEGVVQLLYNNWKWPIVVLKDLNITIFEYVYIGLKGIKEKIKL